MDKRSLLDRLLLSKPTNRVIIQWVILAVTGIVGIQYSWSTIPYFPVTNITGGIILLAGIALHKYSKRRHKDACQISENITMIITDNIYSKIRHPLYLSSIFMNFGYALACGVLWTLILAFIFSGLVILVAIKEEEFLLEKFGEEFKDYMTKVQWRMIPGIF